MSTRSNWTRRELLIAFALYCRIPFGRLHRGNTEIIRFAGAIGRTPGALAMKLSNLASLDPEITSTGRKGLRGTSANDRAMWEEMQGDWGHFAIESEQAVREVVAIAGLNEEAREGDTPERFGENRASERTVRLGQDFFRAAVLSAYNERCCITGLSLPSLLIASHIIPWSHDRTNRVNPRNGLLLSALHDKAFDSGLITIRDDMTVQVSRKYSTRNDTFLSESIEHYDGKPITLPEKFTPGREFLSYHREYVFEN